MVTGRISPEFRSNHGLVPTGLQLNFDRIAVAFAVDRYRIRNYEHGGVAVNSSATTVAEPQPPLPATMVRFLYVPNSASRWIVVRRMAKAASGLIGFMS